MLCQRMWAANDGLLKCIQFCWSLCCSQWFGVGNPFPGLPAPFISLQTKPTADLDTRSGVGHGVAVRSL